MSDEKIPPFYMVPLQRLSIYRDTADTTQMSDKLAITLLGESIVSFTGFASVPIKTNFYTRTVQTMALQIKDLIRAGKVDNGAVFSMTKNKKGFDGQPDEKHTLTFGRTSAGLFYIEVMRDSAKSEPFVFETFKNDTFSVNNEKADELDISRSMFITWIDSLCDSIEATAALMTWTTKLQKPGTPKKTYASNNNNNAHAASGGSNYEDNDIPF